MGEPAAASSGDILKDEFGVDIANKLDSIVIGTGCTFQAVASAVVKSPSSAELAGPGGKWKTVADELGVPAETCNIIRTGILLGTIERVEDVLQRVFQSAIVQHSDRLTLGNLCRVFLQRKMLDFAVQVAKQFCSVEINKTKVKSENN